jgi:hypothetical protein
MVPAGPVPIVTGDDKDALFFALREGIGQEVPDGAMSSRNESSGG